jgi:hypothetical protein
MDSNEMKNLNNHLKKVVHSDRIKHVYLNLVWIAKELFKNKTGVWGCVQAGGLWSTEEEVYMRPGHHWICE